MFRFLVAIVLALGASGIPASVLRAEGLHLHGTTMGPIVWNVRVEGHPADLAADFLRDRILARLEHVDRLMSTWRADSEISRFNGSARTGWIAVAPETAAVVATAIDVSRATGGAFDVTVAPLVNLWSFGERDVPQRIPADAEIAAARQTVGWQLVEVRHDPPALRKSNAEVTLNLSAIAKGFAVDEVSRELEKLNVAAYLVEIGGELRTRGSKHDGSPWRVGIERPQPGWRRSVERAIVLGDRALATSGDYRSYYEVDGVRFSHTIDPATGRPINHRLASVSVVADDCTTADAWATALMVLGPERGYDRAVELELPALFLVRNAAGTSFIARSTPEFDRTVHSPDRSPGSSPTDSTQPTPASSVTTYLIAFAVFLVAILAMSVGVILGNRRIKGSCGGLANITDSTGKSVCEACTNPRPTCGGVEEGRERDAAPVEHV